jgi:Flp pilus assembly protein TadG
MKEGSMRSIGRRLGRERGAVAVEFALIMPLLLLIVVGTIQFGRVWSQYQVFQGAAREGARCAAVQAASATAGLTGCDIQARIDEASGAYTPAVPAAVTVGGAASPGGCVSDTMRGQNVRVFWEQPLDINIPFWGDVTVSSTIEATFRCE